MNHMRYWISLWIFIVSASVCLGQSGENQVRQKTWFSKDVRSSGSFTLDGPAQLRDGANVTGALTAGTVNGSTTSDWDLAHSERRQWDGGSASLDAATGRTSLGLGSAATRSAVDTLVNDNTLPSGSAIINYLLNFGLASLDGVFSTNGILTRTGLSTYSTIANNSANWDSGYSERRQWDGGATNLNATTGRTSLGLGSAAQRTAADVVGNNESLPDGAAIMSYIAGLGYITSADDSVSASELDGTFSTTGLLKRSGAASYSTITDNSTNWDSAYSDRLKWDGGATGLNATTGRASLGLGSAATRSANDSLTNDSSLPSGSAIIGHYGSTVGPTVGGTGQTGVSVGDLLYGSAANTWGRLTLGTAGYRLGVNAAGTGLEWKSPQPPNPIVPSDGNQNLTGSLTVSSDINGSGALYLSSIATPSSYTNKIWVDTSGYFHTGGTYIVGSGMQLYGDDISVNRVLSTTNRMVLKGAGGFDIYTKPSSSMVCAMNIDQSGNVGIGNGSGVSAVAKLDVNGTQNVSGDATFAAKVFFTPHAQTISAATDTINSSYRQVDLTPNPGVDFTFTSTPTIAVGSIDGQLVTIYNKSSSKTFTLQNFITLSGSRLWFPGGATTYTLGLNRTATFRWDSFFGGLGGTWVLQAN